MDWITQLALCEALGDDGTCTVGDRRAVPLVAAVLGPRCREERPRPHVLAWPDGTRMVLPATAPAAGPASPPADPGAAPEVRAGARALRDAMASGTVDGFDRTRALLDRTGQALRLSFDGAGGAAFALDPLECLVPRDGETLLSHLPQRALALSAREPRRIRVPMLESPSTTVILRFTGSAPHGQPEVALAAPGPSLEVLQGTALGLPELRLHLSATPGPTVDLDLLGHRLALEAVDCLLGNPCRQPAAPPPDPLARYGDPLDAYATGGER